MPHCELPPRSCEELRGAHRCVHAKSSGNDAQRHTAVILSGGGARTHWDASPDARPHVCWRRLSPLLSPLPFRRTLQPGPRSTRLRTNFPNTPVLLTGPLVQTSPTWRVNITCFMWSYPVTRSAAVISRWLVACWPNSEGWPVFVFAMEPGMKLA